MDREEISFASGDARCAAWLYRPSVSARDLPCVVMAHGFGAVREAALAHYAERFAEPGVGWRNEVTGRSPLEVGIYSPGRRAGRVRCPLLVQVAAVDAITPPGPACRVAERAPRGEVRVSPGGQFGLYSGEPFERVVSDQVEFLGRSI